MAAAFVGQDQPHGAGSDVDGSTNRPRREARGRLGNVVGDAARLCSRQCTGPTILGAVA